MTTIIAVGDIHGCYDELHQLIDHIHKLDLEPIQWIFLGDYVDRGPDSKKVVEFLIKAQALRPSTICLKGNHDDMMTWGQHHEYIEETLRSYDCDPMTFPTEHMTWIKKLPLYHQDDMGRVYVHAAIDRVKPLHEQTEMVMLWGRDPYLKDHSMDGGYVVHGHSVVRSNLPEVYHNRCAVDTGCCFGRVLSAAIFTDERIGPSILVNHRGAVHRFGAPHKPALVWS